MADVFISYSRKDSTLVTEFSEKLTEAGISVWIDREGIDLATNWSGEIVDAIEACKAFVVILSASSVESHNVSKEVSIASELKKSILPLDIEVVELSRDLRYHLAGLQRAPLSNFDAVLRSLARLGLEPRRKHPGNIGDVTPATSTPTAPVIRHMAVVPVTDDRKSLMILPFEDLSPTRDNEWFVDGIASELISALSGIKSLRLSNHQATKEFKTYKGKLSDYAWEMNVRYFLQGAVRKAGNQIKITMQLLDVETGDHLWQDSHKGIMDDIFEIQEQVATKVVDGFKLHLTKAEVKHLAHRGTENVEAYELYLKGMEYYERRTREHLNFALRLLDESLRLDPAFIRVYFQKAMMLTELYRIYDRREQHLVEAERLATTAQSLDPNFVEIHNALCAIYLQQQRLPEAEAAARRFIELAPDNADSHFSLGFFYSQIDEPAKAIPCFEESIRLNPDFLVAHWNLVLVCDRAHDISRKIKAALQAVPSKERRIRLFPDDEYARVEYANLLYYAGDEATAREFLHRQDKIMDGVSLYNLGCLASKLREFELAVDLLGRSLTAGMAFIEALRSDPDLDPLRGREDFEKLLAATNALQNSSAN
ncbi:MAG TPA: TIR domain-containing protein [Candidatus Kapabacteria bacterium]|nr:TIR domain-containing protein [Candidatus Kapabacteria bacterium]